MSKKLFFVIILCLLITILWAEEEPFGKYTYNAKTVTQEYFMQMPLEDLISFFTIFVTDTAEDLAFLRVLSDEKLKELKKQIQNKPSFTDKAGYIESGINIGILPEVLKEYTENLQKLYENVEIILVERGLAEKEPFGKYEYFSHEVTYEYFMTKMSIEDLIMFFYYDVTNTSDYQAFLEAMSKEKLTEIKEYTSKAVNDEKNFIQSYLNRGYDDETAKELAAVYKQLYYGVTLHLIDRKEAEEEKKEEWHTTLEQGLRIYHDLEVVGYLDLRIEESYYDVSFEITKHDNTLGNQLKLEYVSMYAKKKKQLPVFIETTLYDKEQKLYTSRLSVFKNMYYSIFVLNAKTLESINEIEQEIPAGDIIILEDFFAYAPYFIEKEWKVNNVITTIFPAYNNPEGIIFTPNTSVVRKDKSDGSFRISLYTLDPVEAELITIEYMPDKRIKSITTFDGYSFKPD